MKINRINKKNIETVSNLNIEACDKPKTWDIISALDFIIKHAKNSKLNQDFWKRCEEPLEYLENTLTLTKAQIVFLAVMIETGEPISWRGFSKFFNCSRISVMTYSEEIEELVYKGWIRRRGDYESGRHFQGLVLEHGVVTALRRNKTFTPRNICGLDIQKFCDLLEYHLNHFFSIPNNDLEAEEEWLQHLCQVNDHLQLCRELLKYQDIHVLSLMLFIVYDYAQWAGSNDEGLTYMSIDNTYPEDFDVNFLRAHLNDGTHPLMESGLMFLLNI